MIGAGNYASRILIPAFAKAGARFHTLVASGGIGPAHVGRKYGFRHASTDFSPLLADPSCNTVVIATRHDSHALLVQQALAAGKHVFVEKPLCLTAEELVATVTSCPSYAFSMLRVLHRSPAPSTPRSLNRLFNAV